MAAKEKEKKTGRNFFRIPVEDIHDASITIKGTKYSVINIATQGVGFYLEDTNTFEVDTELLDINLSLNGVTTTIKGRIAHVSPSNIHYLCGIEIIDMNEQTADLLQGFIDQHKASLFSFMP